MLPSFITNLFWGSNEEKGYSQQPSDEDHFITEQRDDWVLISEQGHHQQQKTSDTQSECSENSLGWVVTPPGCGQGEGQAAHNSMEDLLIEHPSMSVYIMNDDLREEVPALPHPVEPQVEDNRVAVRPMAHVAALHPIIKSTKQYPNIIKKIPKLTKKATKRHNQQKNNCGKHSKKCQAMRQGCFNAGHRHC